MKDGVKYLLGSNGCEGVKLFENFSNSLPKNIQNGINILLDTVRKYFDDFINYSN